MNKLSSIVTVSKFLTVFQSTAKTVVGFGVASLLLCATGAHAQAPTGARVDPSAAAAAASGFGFPRPLTVSEKIQGIRDGNLEYKKICMPNGKPLDLSSPDYEACETMRSELGFGRESSKKCESYINNIDRAAEALKKSCSDGKWGGATACLTNLKKCEDEYQNAVSESEEDDGEVLDSICKSESFKIVGRCSHIDPLMDDRDYKTEEKDAERDRRDAKKDVDDLLDQQREAQQEILTKQQEMRSAADKSQLAMRNRERDIAKGIKEALKSVSEGKKKAMEQAQTAYAEIESKYMQMRNDMSIAQVEVTEAENALETKCRADARKSLAEAEKARLAAQARGRRNTGTAAGLAGSSRRRQQSQDTQKRFDYVQYFNDCVSDGQPGMRSVKARFEAKKKAMQEQADFIERRRAEMLQKLKDMEGSATAEEQAAISDAQEQLTALGEEYTQLQKDNQLKAQTFQSQQQLKLQNIQAKLSSAQQDMDKYAAESLFAKRRNLCGAGSRGNRKDDARDSRASVLPSWDAAITACSGYERNVCKVVDTKATGEFCDSIQSKFIEDKLKESKGKRSRK